tara:strand:+ start:2168 stop:3076 length:909 start_codon:yes stop_codon:yes gene_type:complete
MSKLLDLIKGKTKPHYIADALKKGGGRMPDLVKGAPYIGPKGGKWNDPDHKTPYNEKKHEVDAVSMSRHRATGGGTATEFSVHDPHEPGGKAHHTYIGRGKTPGERRTHALQQHKAKHGIERDVKHTNFDRKKANHARKQSEKGRGSAAAGKHHVADSDGGFREVDTHHAAGHYAVHDATSDNEKQMAKLKGRKPKREFAVTHKPTGMSLGRHSERKAKKLADHMHEHAGDSGSTAKFGKNPSKADVGAMQAAFMKFGKSDGDNPDLVKAEGDREPQTGGVKNTLGYSDEIMQWYTTGGDNA